MNIAWSGLADSVYYHYIAKYCLPSWETLPGDKFIVHDAKEISINDLNIVAWDKIYNRNNTFTQKCQRTKPLNFWRKMQSQIWALKSLQHYDFVILLDTDIEIIDINILKLENIFSELKNQNLIWAIGQSQKNKLDAGHIVVNMKNQQLRNLIFDYEYIWESGKIFEFRRFYDGNAIEYLQEKYPSLKIKNIDHGGGLHTYELGTVHYGSKFPKLLRALYKGNSKNMISSIISEKNKLIEDKVSIEDLEKKRYEAN